MFEAHVLHLLRKYLGEYVHGLSTEALRISVWKGDVVLKDLKLKAEALNSLKLPVTVTAGFVGTITLKVPWKSLGKEPVIVLIDRVFVLAHPAPDGQSLKDEDREKLFESKLQQIEEAELAMLEATSRGSKIGNSTGGNSWLGSLIATIIGNLKITISNVHIRYEDSISNPGHPFCSGITLAKLAAVTTDELGNETFDTSGALDKLRKSLHLQRLAVYHDSDTPSWKLHKNWEDLTPVEWTEIFADGIDEIGSGKSVSSWAMNRTYLVSPINGVLKYHRLGKQEKHNPEIPFEKASLVLTDVTLTILEAQYYDGIKLLETLSRYKTRVEVSHLRPVVPVSEHPDLWWRYAVQATLQQKKMCYRISWERIRHLCHLRRCYVQLYASLLRQCTKENSSQIREIERDLDSKVIILWRLLAHAKVESVKSKEATRQTGTLKRSWWSFGWRTSSGDASSSSDSVETQLVEDKLTKEEWQTINKLLSYEVDEDNAPTLGKDMQTTIQSLVDISIERAAARIVNIDQTEILCGRFEQLQVTTKLYHKSIHCDVLLRFCGLSCPEGSLAQSVSSEKKVNALAATFIHSPVGENIDWRLSATIAPCHVTVLMESYERFLGFMKRSNAVSPTVALETATALQTKIEQVTRRAQEQLQIVLEEQSRFALDIDIDAPKLRIPFKDSSSDSSHGNFLLDFGHFTLHTREGERDEQRQSIYSRFYISGRDIAAFFSDGTFDDVKYSATKIVDDHISMQTTLEGHTSFYSLIDRCRMSVVVDQIKVPHPSYPSTRISIQVPSLGIHFSPARYRRIFDLLYIFYSSMESSEQHVDAHVQTDLAPWYPADLSSDARILVWRGIGNSLAEWKPCFLILSGLYLYVLESGTSQHYQRCCSMAGRYVFEVSPASVGGSRCSVAVSFRGHDIQKALESSSTLLIEFRNEVEKTMWLKGLVQATYQASAHPVIDVLGKSDDSLHETTVPHDNFGAADLVINGALVETKLSIYGMVKDYGPNSLDMCEESAGEVLIIELLAGGGKVNVVRRGSDMSARMKLHSLKIRDELQGRLSTSPQYLASSMLNQNLGASSLNDLDSDSNVVQNLFLEEDDVFRDALQEFVGAADQNYNTQSLEIHAETNYHSFGGGEDHTGAISVKDAVDFGKYRARGTSTSAEVFYEAEDNDSSDFVAVTFVTKYQDSPLYDGVDTQMNIRMSKLDFYCNRPTLVALIDFGLDLSFVNSTLRNTNDVDKPMDKSTHNSEKAEDKSNSEKGEESRRDVIKGLLGYGKRRIVFYLSMDVDSVCVYLNKEDGSQLAMFVQESFLFDLKVHPSSISIEGSLGNLRLCDMSLGPDHCWGWLCDIRNQRIESLIKFTFQSFSAEDDDYDGHDYSLSGRLSAVRIVFLYRFVQEIMTYFMELATPHTEEVIKFVDKVGDFEWLIKKYEIDGSSSLKLDLSLDTPVIVLPYNSTSENFIQLDLGRLQISNSFRWHGEPKDPSSVHLDILLAEIHGINMAVGVNSCLGKPMIREAQGLKIEVRRSLRDVFRKVPTVSVEIKVGLLHCVMTDKEYSIILDCAYANISEEPRLPSSFRGNTNVTKDSIRILADKVNTNSQILLSHTVAVVAVEIRHALLDLRNGFDEESPLAQIVLEGLWISYRYTSFSETDLYVSIPKFSILDIRTDTKPEMHLMLGSSSDAYRLGACSSCQLIERNLQPSNDDVPFGISTYAPNLTMLIMDYRWRSSCQSFVIRMQQPRVLVVLDFLVAVAEFFVPALRSITGRDETLDPKNDPITRNDNIVLSGPVHMQSTDIIHLSPSRQLIVDGPGFDEVIYDGCGGKIHLSEDYENSGHSSSGLKPFIIILGRGKRLRFKNVKIENGALLLKFAYLDVDSSYSVSPEDGVEISQLENFDMEADNDKSEIHQGSLEMASVTDTASTDMRSFSFEAQVVSPEFTFYDSTKVCKDESMHLEKLLRAKMDMSFMFATKENDIWVRSLVKDLTLEAGSGLVVLEPIDISGGYTSIKDKTNISVVSTDICIHLSLSVASLLLQLQYQAFAALQFGNAKPLASCTNFKRIWVSRKGSLPDYNLTFWRPQAPSNYVILGDCVTSRPVPPSQVVTAVSNTYGRVRKPVGFKLIGVFSDLQGSEGRENQSDADSDCSLWMPLAPSGYSAVGCVANVGRNPPPNHVVYCIRSDLITSATFSDCIFSVLPNQRALSGFSIWRIDNAMVSFHAHDSVDCPPKNIIFDLHHILSDNRDWRPLTNKSSPIPSVQHCRTDHLEGKSDNNFSGWEILRSFSKSSTCYLSTPHFERIWWDKGCDLRKAISVWRPLPRQGFSILGDCLVEGLEPPSLGLIFKCDSSEISAKPVQFTKVAHIMRKGLDEAYFWYPIAPPGYASLGCVVTKTDDMPNKDLFCCPRMDLVNQANIFELPLARSSTSRGSNCWSIWKVENQANTFLARSDHKRPSNRLAYALSNYVKPKTRENISVEMKLGNFSVTILDGICGMITPLFDTTITNINLATHGRFEAMNAVLVCSIAASTFNRQLEAWEPLVEPFDGIFKVETYDTNECTPAKVGKRLRVAATSAVNLNISAGNLETLVESIVSWRKQTDLRQKSIKNEESDEYSKSNDDLSLSALDEDNLEKIILENRLSCDLYIKKVEQTSETVAILPHGNQASVVLPPPRFSDRLNVVSESRETRYYAAIQIFHAKGLPIVDDGNGHDLFCALRLVIDGTSSGHRLFPQSARTRCVRPLVSKIDNTDVGNVRWNELFLFEVPEKGLATLELEITNLASKAGKGETVAALSVPIRNNASALKRAASVKMLLESTDTQQLPSYFLKRKGQMSDSKQDCGVLFMSTFLFERSTILNLEKEPDNVTMIDGDIGFWVGLSPEGPWKTFGSLLPLSVIPESLDGKQFAFEVSTRNGRKHAIFRPLAMVINDTDVKIELSICPAFIMETSHQELLKSSMTVTEEIFENQIYQSSGSGNKWSGCQTGDLCHWSTRDFSQSSKDFLEIPLPPGWKWTSAWTIEKSQFVDSDGWAYGRDFQSLHWPPSYLKACSKSSTDVVRRRRWIRTRQQLPEKNTDNMRNMFAIVDPGSSAVLPWSSMSGDTDFCLQVRPYNESSDVEYTWSQTFSITSNSSATNENITDQGLIYRQNTMKNGNIQLSSFPFKLNQLEKMDFLLYCNCSIGTKQNFWLNMGTDASVLHTDLNIPVYDWKITVSSPLRMENKLPYSAEYSIWEKTKEGNSVERQHGIISPGGTVFVHSADLRRLIFLTLFIQGGWMLEKDAVLIMDLSTINHVSSFWMIQKQSKRRLRISVEYDMGGTIAAPKTIRFFVPYWISNGSSVPLSYRIMEVEPLDNGDADSISISKAVRSAKSVLKHTSSSIGIDNISSRRNIQALEVIDDPNSSCIMLSPQDYISRSGSLHPQSRSDTFLPQRIGIAIAVRDSEHYSLGISLYELENKERVDVKAFTSDGSYYKLSAVLNVASDRTKVVHFQPQTLLINRVGRSICLMHSEMEFSQWFHTTDPPKLFKWQCDASTEHLKVRVDGYHWSTPFSIQNEGLMCISLKNDMEEEWMYLWAEVRSGAKGSRYEVVFRLASFSSPYRIENQSMFLPVRFRQVGGSDGSWRCLPPNASMSFCWEDLGRPQLLEVLVDGTDPSKSEKYSIDVVKDYHPTQTATGPVKAIRFTVFKEGKMHIARISDWRPENQWLPTADERFPSPMPLSSASDSSSLESEFHVTFELAELGLSVVDHTPEEIVYLSVQNLLLSYSTGLGSGISRLKLRMLSIQVDNQLPFTPMPVLFRPQRIGDETDNVLKFSLTMQSSSSLDLCVYPYLGIQGPENSAFLVNIHEPVIWRLHEMIQRAKLSRIYSSQTSAISVDPTIQIGLLNISEFRFKVSMTMSPTQRPGGVLGFWASLMTALGNMENMTVRINQRSREEISMRQSILISSSISSVQKDLLSQPLRLLSGVDILGNASSALGHISKGVAALSMDKKFIENRQRQESKGVEDIGDVIREGGGALAKGFFRGVTGILTKPLEGAKSSGVEGFVSGVGKGIIGAAAQPVSGVLDLLSKTTEGANAVKMKIASAIASEEQLLRRRLPRVISGDNLLKPYDESKATGQAILQLAESGTFFGQVDLFKVRGKFALSDAYEDHCLLPKGKIIMVTHRRVLLLQQPTNIVVQRKFSPARDPCSVQWDVLWDDLVTMELGHRKKDSPRSPPSRLILYLQTRPTESRENIRVVKCRKESHQAMEIYNSIDKAMNTYGPNRTKEIRSKTITKPYSPCSRPDRSQSKDIYGVPAVPEMPASLSLTSSFGAMIPPHQLGLEQNH